MGQLQVGLRPGPGLPARPGDGGGAMITRRTKVQLLIFVLITLIGRHLRRRALRQARPGLLRRHLHGGGALPGLRRHLRHRSRSPTAASASARSTSWCSPTRASTSTWPSRRSTTRSRRTPSRSSATGRPWASSTSSCSRRHREGPTWRTTPRSPEENTRIPIATETLPQQPRDHRGVGRPGRAAHHRHRVRRRVRWHRRGPPADHRHRQLLHRDRQRQLRHHHGADPRQQHRAARTDRLGQRDPQLRPADGAVQHHARRRRPRPAPPDRHRLGRRGGAAARSSRPTGSSSAS